MITSKPLIGFEINGNKAIYPYKIDEHFFEDKKTGFTFYHFMEIQTSVFNLFGKIEIKNVVIETRTYANIYDRIVKVRL